MAKLKVLYQANLFGDFLFIKPTTEIIMTLLPKLSEFNLLPSTMQEINPVISFNPQDRLSFLNPDRSVTVEIGTDKITINRNATNSEGIDESASDFVNNVIKEVFKVLYEQFDIKGTRVSLIIQTIYNENYDLMEKVFNETMIPISYFKDNKPFEWLNRNVSRGSINNEDTNLILEFGRGKGMFSRDGREIDSLRTLIDINTIFENNKQRIDYAKMNVFLDYALIEKEKIETLVEEIVYGS